MLVNEDSSRPGPLPWMFKMGKNNAFLETGCWPDWPLGILPPLRFLEEGQDRVGTSQLLVGR